MNRLALISLAACAACGPSGDAGAVDASAANSIDAAPGDAAAPPPPLLTAGGGVAPPTIGGTLNVYVVETGGSTPIPSATVRVGTAASGAPLTGVADARGLVVFHDAALTGAQTVTVTASGRTAATWVGVTGANLTIPLDPLVRASPTAQVSGTIAGWRALSGPAFGHYTLAIVVPTFTDDIGAPENNLPQAMTGDAPQNTCVRSTVATDCTWRLTTRIGRQRHVAVIVDGDSQGTADTTDDTYSLIGYATSAGMTLTSGQQVANETLTQVPGGSLVQMTVSFPPALAGLGDVIAIPQLDLGDDGRIVFPLPTVTSSRTSIRVIAASGAFAGSYRLVALARPPGGAAIPNSSVFDNDVSVTATNAIDAWLPAPRQVAVAAGGYSFIAAAGAALHNATFRRSDGTALWTVTLLDGSSSFALPMITPDPRGSGPLTLIVSAVDVTGFNPGNFAVPGLLTQLHRASTASATVR